MNIFDDRGNYCDMEIWGSLHFPSRPMFGFPFRLQALILLTLAECSALGNIFR